MSNNFYGKLPSVNFTVKNVSSQRKSISIFGLSIGYLRTADLMAISEITEAEIKASLTKGELANKIKAGDIKIASSSLNLLEFDSAFRTFIDNANITPGDPVAGTDPYTQVGSGGSGGYVIEGGGELTGTYHGDVLCKGEATLTGHVTVNGTLTVLGDLINDSRYELTVRGDLHANQIDFTSDDSSMAQSNVTVDGDLFFTLFDFPQSGGAVALLRVGGNLTGTSGEAGTTLNGYGLDDTSGLNVLVYGDLKVANVRLYGGDSSASNAGNGGSLVVYGDADIAYELRINGGNSTNADSGYGGSVEVYGNLVMGDDSYDVDFNGGDADNGNAGNAGSLEVHGDCVLTNGDGEAAFIGGGCYSDNENHRAGSGGNIDIYGDLQCDNDLEIYGGYRSGTLSASGSVEPPHGGNLFVKGDARVDEIDNDGGVIDTSNFAPCGGGNAGSITVYGNLTIDEEIYSSGGYCNFGSGGNGGDITVRGDLIVDDEIQIDGQDGNNGGTGGNAGSINVYGNLVCADYIDIYGGDSDSNNAGSGGSINVEGVMYCDRIYADGGNCSSTNEIHYAGSGGSIDAREINSSNSSIYIDAGERSGATTVSNTGNSAAYPGNFNCQGNCTVYGIYGSGSYVTTNYPNSIGTNGSSLYIDGNLICEYIDIEGGDSVGNTAGRGGSLYVKGFAKLYQLDAQGGDANDSIGIGADAGINGAGPDFIEVQNGINAYSLVLQDGSGAMGSSAPSNDVTLRLYGSNTIYSLNMTDRATCYIKPDSNRQCILKIGTLVAKNTLNDTSNVASADISADVADHLYISNGTTWYGLAGSAIFV